MSFHLLFRYSEPRIFAPASGANAAKKPVSLCRASEEIETGVSISGMFNLLACLPHDITETLHSGVQDSLASQFDRVSCCMNSSRKRARSLIEVIQLPDSGEVVWPTRYAHPSVRTLLPESTVLIAIDSEQDTF
jgi:hypothetical protein